MYKRDNRETEVRVRWDYISFVNLEKKAGVCERCRSGAVELQLGNAAHLSRVLQAQGAVLFLA